MKDINSYGWESTEFLNKNQCLLLYYQCCIYFCNLVYSMYMYSLYRHIYVWCMHVYIIFF
jgi:hypothetical protein